MPENPSPVSFATEVVWIVGTVVVSYAAIYAARKTWKLGRTIVALKTSKVKP